MNEDLVVDAEAEFKAAIELRPDYLLEHYSTGSICLKRIFYQKVLAQRKVNL